MYAECKIIALSFECLTFHKTNSFIYLLLLDVYFPTNKITLNLDSLAKSV